jgi:hypothetical protein
MVATSVRLVSCRVFRCLLLDRSLFQLALTTRAPSNKSLDASGGGVFRIITGPAMLE